MEPFKEHIFQLRAHTVKLMTAALVIARKSYKMPKDESSKHFSGNHETELLQREANKNKESEISRLQSESQESMTREIPQLIPPPTNDENEIGDHKRKTIESGNFEQGTRESKGGREDFQRSYHHIKRPRSTEQADKANKKMENIVSPQHVHIPPNIAVDFDANHDQNGSYEASGPNDVIRRSVLQMQLQALHQEMQHLRFKELQEKLNNPTSSTSQLAGERTTHKEVDNSQDVIHEPIVSNEEVVTNSDANQDDQGPYRRLSMLAAASLLETVNNSAPNESKEHENTFPDTQNLNPNFIPPTQVNHGEKESRRHSLDFSGLEGNMNWDELFGRMSRRNSLLSVASASSNGGNGFDNSLFSRRLSLIAAQAASLESRNITRRASLLAAASIFESLTNDASNNIQGSLIGGGMPINRRNSLLAVSSLLNTLENGNGQPRRSPAFRRGSDVSVGSVFSDVSTMHPSRRSSLDTLNNFNTIRPDLENVNKMASSMGMNGNVENIANYAINMDSIKALYLSMEKSKASQTAIHDWDKKMGLRRSHSQTMRNSSRSRKKLINVMTLGKVNYK